MPRVPHGKVNERARILVAGGGLVGTYTALRLQRTLRAELDRGAAEIVVITPRPWMTYLPFLPEAASGSLSPRHVIVPLRKVLDRCRVVAGEVTAVDHAARTAYVKTAATRGDNGKRNSAQPDAGHPGSDCADLAGLDFATPDFDGLDLSDLDFPDFDFTGSGYESGYGSGYDADSGKSGPYRPSPYEPGGYDPGVSKPGGSEPRTPGPRTSPETFPEAPSASDPDPSPDRTVGVPYDELVLALGRADNVPSRPGLVEHAFGFHGIEDAIALRSHILEQLDIASTTRDPAVHDAALTFVFTGGGLTGAGVLAELEDMARQAVRSYPNLSPSDLRWVLVEPCGRLLPELPESYEWTCGEALTELRRRGVDVRLDTQLESCEKGAAVLSDGSRFNTRTVVWSAGWTTEATAHPVLAATGLPLDAHGRIRCTPSLAVADTPHAWAAGAAAAVPTPGPDSGTCSGTCSAVPPTAELALNQAELLGDNIARSLHGQPLKDYVPDLHGISVPLGLHKAVVQVNGRRATGLKAWLLHRAHHLGILPRINRRARVLAEWSLAGLFSREVVSFGSLKQTPTEFELAAGGTSPTDPKGSS